MSGKRQSGLEHTAYLTSCERAMFPHISRDTYARHWIPRGTWKLLDEFLKCRDFSPALVAARNRYFLERTTEFFGEGPGVLINIAAGMSSYPFLLEQKIEHVEIDSPDMIGHKKEWRRNMETRGLIPQRSIMYVACDLNVPHAAARIAAILECNKRKRAFILLEGIVYYLLPDCLRYICGAIDGIVFEDSANVGVVYWDRSLEGHPFLADYHSFTRRYSGTIHPFQLHETSDFEAYFSNYRQRESGRFKDVLPSFGGPCLTENVFSENYLLLEFNRQ